MKIGTLSDLSALNQHYDILSRLVQHLAMKLSMLLSCVTVGSSCDFLYGTLMGVCS